MQVVRDDLLLGGSKVRALPALVAGAEEVVYAGPSIGYAQLAIAVAARAAGARATLFLPERSQPTSITAAALAAGARVVWVAHGRLGVLRARAAGYCGQTGARNLPFGLDHPLMECGLAAAAAQLPRPSEVWVAAGSGTLARSLASAWPGVQVCAVQVGRPPRLPAGARLFKPPERFDEPARVPPPFPSAAYYDAKAWRFVCAEATPGAMFWNVAGNPNADLASLVD